MPNSLVVWGRHVQQKVELPVLATAHTLNRLGPVGTAPREGDGTGMLRVASELEKIGFQLV